MNCTRCKLKREIDAYAAEEASGSRTRTVSEARRLELIDACMRCGANGADTFSHKGMSQVRLDTACMGDGAAIRPSDGYAESRRPTGHATSLAGDDEDKLRVAMAEMFQLDPVELLMVRHVVNGGRLYEFGTSLVEIAKRYGKLKQSAARSFADAVKNRVLEKWSAFASIIPATSAGGNHSPLGSPAARRLSPLGGRKLENLVKGKP